MTELPTEYDILTTRGITSEVKDSDGVVLGHALLLDYDDSASFDRMLSDVADLPGLTAIFESSPGSWHVWNSTVRTTDDTALAMLGSKADPQHASIGYRRGRWTIRLGPKHRENASAGHDDDPEEYKAAPDPLEVFVNSSQLAQSRPHINLALAVFPDDTAERMRERVDRRCPTVVGDAYRVEQYRTLTDELKEKVRNDE